MRPADRTVVRPEGNQHLLGRRHPVSLFLFLFFLFSLFFLLLFFFFFLFFSFTSFSSFSFLLFPLFLCFPPSPSSLPFSLLLLFFLILFLSLFLLPSFSLLLLRWSDLGTDRLPQGQIPGLPRGYGGTTLERITWIEAHYAFLRMVFEGDPAFMEYDTADPQAPAQIAAHLGLHLPWWGKANENTRTPEQTPREHPAGRSCCTSVPTRA